MVWAWNLVCGRFINFRNGRKFLTLLTFGCPPDDNAMYWSGGATANSRNWRCCSTNCRVCRLKNDTNLFLCSGCLFPLRLFIFLFSTDDRKTSFHKDDAVESNSKLFRLEMDFTYFSHLQSWKLQAKPYEWNCEKLKQELENARELYSQTQAVSIRLASHKSGKAQPDTNY